MAWLLSGVGIVRVAHCPQMGNDTLPVFGRWGCDGYDGKKEIRSRLVVPDCTSRRCRRHDGLDELGGTIG